VAGELRANNAIDELLQRTAQATPREAVVFLLGFDRHFRAETGQSPSQVQRLIVTSLLRRRAVSDR
jgi:hypothetical protein